MTDEWNDEQRVLLAVLRVQNVADPEAVVRADRLAATALGSELVPTVRAMVALLVGMVGELVAVLPADEGGAE